MGADRALQNGSAGFEPGETPLARLFSLCNAEQSREYHPEKRSLRIHGHSTTIRLERAFWSVLDEMASEEGVTAATLVTRIHDHCLSTNDKNLASCLRVVCLKYINLGA
ncbi:MAG: ribbon-helix-helix domain-containing protein [Actinomycetota bacterium]